MRRVYSVLIIVLTATLLSGCFGGGEDELSQLKKQSRSNDFNVLIETRADLIKYIEEGEKKKTAQKTLDKVNEKVKENIRERIDSAYTNKDIKEAYKLSNVLIDIDPDAEDAVEAYNMIKEDYEVQIQVDELISLIEESYESLYGIFIHWDNVLEEVLIKGGSEQNIMKVATYSLEDAKNLRIKTQERNLNITDSSLYDIQEELYIYLNSLEDSLEKVLTDKLDASDAKSEVKELQPSYFNNVFVGIQDGLNNYVNSVDADGNLIYNIKGELNLGKKEDKTNIEYKLEDELKKDEEEKEVEEQEEEVELNDEEE